MSLFLTRLPSLSLLLAVPHTFSFLPFPFMSTDYNLDVEALPGDTRFRSIELLTRFLLGTLVHAKEKNQLRPFADHLRGYYSKHVPVCSSLASYRCALYLLLSAYCLHIFANFFACLIFIFSFVSSGLQVAYARVDARRQYLALRHALRVRCAGHARDSLTAVCTCTKKCFTCSSLNAPPNLLLLSLATFRFILTSALHRS